jgi:riboflavin synthase
MFTGIIEAAGKIESLEHGPEGGRLRVAFAPPTAGVDDLSAHMKLGDSISVNGCCLTVVEFDKKHFAADLSGETLRRTSFGEKKPGGIVNLERPLAAGARLGGHFVQGHVDGVGRVTRLVPEGNNWWLSVRVPEDLRRYVAEKGSIALDGISLTVARWQDGIADVAVIPFTHEHTSVRAMAAGDAINIETDILAKYVESLLRARKSSGESRVTVTRLVEEGF